MKRANYLIAVVSVAVVLASTSGPASAVIANQMDTQEEVAQETGILFPFDSAELTPEVRANLRKLADSLQAEARTYVVILGHTDSNGRNSYNQQLSERRGRAAENYLASLGVRSSRLVSRGRGEAEPITSNGTGEGRRRNRRVEVVIYANGDWRAEAED